MYSPKFHGGGRPIVDIREIQSALFASPQIVARMARDFGMAAQVTDPRSFSLALVMALGQQSLPNPLEAGWENSHVYRAAVRALGSNSRAWATFLRNELQLADLLGGYDPNVEPDLASVRQCLPGQSGSNDARAVVKWRVLLTRTPSYFERLAAMGRALQEMNVSKAELPMCMAVVIGSPPPPRKVAGELKRVLQKVPESEWKAPGMGPILASEFLRNLGFSGFKPDRHVVRLLGRWFPDVADSCQQRAMELGTALGKRSAEIYRFLRFSLTGVAVSPSGYSYSEIDNLVWALGAYVERKGRESDRPYRRQRDD